jgi:hypothetical protein
MDRSIWWMKEESRMHGWSRMLGGVSGGICIKIV